MAYDELKPADDDLLSAAPALIRENFRALIEDSVIKTLETGAFCGPDRILVQREKAAQTTDSGGAGWYRVASSGLHVSSNVALLLISWWNGSPYKSGSAMLAVGMTDGKTASATIKALAFSSRGADGLTKARIVYHTTPTNRLAYLEIYLGGDASGVSCSVIGRMKDSPYWRPMDMVAGEIPDGYLTVELDINADNQNHGKQKFTTTGNWVVPPGVRTVWVSGCGGGGGGGGAGRENATTYHHGEGGSAGGFVKSVGVTVVPGATWVATIGAGGAGGACGASDSTDGSDGTAGGNTTFGESGEGVSITCSGGTGGTKGTSTAGAGDSFNVIGRANPFGSIGFPTPTTSPVGRGTGGLGGRSGSSAAAAEGITGAAGVLILDW